jgi:hypothetical protein
MFKLEIATDNAAFGESPVAAQSELGRMLGDLAIRLRYGTAGLEGMLKDRNGNRVGTWSLELPARGEGEE